MRKYLVFLLSCFVVLSPCNLFAANMAKIIGDANLKNKKDEKAPTIVIKVRCVEQFAKKMDVTVEKAEQAKGSDRITYIEAKGFACAKKYYLYQVNALGNSVLVNTYFGEKDGSLRAKDGKLISNITIFNGGFLHAEPTAYQVTNEDKIVLATAYYIPKPLELVWDDGAKVEVVLRDASAKNFYIFMYDFQPNETVQFISKSYHETLSDPIVFEGTAYAMIDYKPGVIGKKGGTAVATFKRKNFEPKELKIYWGTEALERKDEL